MKKVLIRANEKGSIYNETKTKGLFFVHLTSSEIKLSNNFLKKVTLHCNVFANLDLLKETFAADATSIPGKLYIVESFTGDDDNIKRAGSDGPELLGLHPNGEHLPIYRKIFYDATGTKKDVLIPHTNVDEIKEHLQGAEYASEDTTEEVAQA